VPAPQPEPLLSVDLEMDLAPERDGALVLRNPILIASGVLGYGVEYAEVVDLDGLGAIVTRGTTLKPRTGNPPPRTAEMPAGLLNAVGLQNPGVEAVLERYAPRWASWSVPVILNLAAETADEFAALARALDSQPGISGVELNLSCPNRAKGGLLFCLDADAAAQVTAAVRRATDLPVLVKLSAAAQDMREVAGAVEDAGADAISAINTLPGMAIDRGRGAPRFSTVYGGLSGPALKPIALRAVHEVAKEVRIPIIAAGGAGSLDDVLDFLYAGASAVQVGTAVLADPGLPLRLVDELEAWCLENGQPSVRGLIGLARTTGRARPSVKGVEYRP
jgi:dihydroorotate dehydrogenase (NAD+) catalytic subunit